ASGNEACRLRVFTARQRRGSLCPARRRRRRAADCRRPDPGAADGDAARAADPPRRHRPRARARPCARGGGRDRDRRRPHREHDPLVRAKLPLLARALTFVGHGATRARGTIGGSLANGDSAAEIDLVAVTLGATLLYREGAHSGEIAAEAFFVGPMATALPTA